MSFQSRKIMSRSAEATLGATIASVDAQFSTAEYFPGIQILLNTFVPQVTRFGDAGEISPDAAQALIAGALDAAGQTTGVAAGR